MFRTDRLTDALRGRGKALVFLGAAAGLAGAGTASAATGAPAAQAGVGHTVADTAPTAGAVSIVSADGHAAPVSTAGSAGATVFGTASGVAPTGLWSPLTAPAHKPVARVQLESANASHQQAATQHQVATPVVTHQAVVPAKSAAPAPPAKPWLIYDSVTPTSIPGHHEVATYATGGYAVNPSQVAGRHVLWIDTNGSDPRGAAALDVEPGDATPSMAANWVAQKLHGAANGVAIVYTMRSEWPATQAAVNALPGWMHGHVRWWIADPTGYPHIVPGSNATQWYWGQNFDITTAAPGFQS